MERGVEFLKSQVSNAVLMHRTLVEALKDHESQASDQRLRDLCLRFIPKMLQHQRMLEDYQLTLGATDGLVNRAAGVALGVARDLADVVREDDFLRLVGDIVLARQMEDTFKTFREAGRTLGLQQLAQIGEIGERHHDEYAKEANRLVQQMFVERVRGSEETIRTAEQPTTAV
jgi:hypothetical protein